MWILVENETNRSVTFAQHRLPFVISGKYRVLSTDSECGDNIVRPPVATRRCEGAAGVSHEWVRPEPSAGGGLLPGPRWRPARTERAFAGELSTRARAGFEERIGGERDAGGPGGSGNGYLQPDYRFILKYQTCFLMTMGAWLHYDGQHNSANKYEHCNCAIRYMWYGLPCFNYFNVNSEGFFIKKVLLIYFLIHS